MSVVAKAPDGVCGGCFCVGVYLCSGVFLWVYDGVFVQWCICMMVYLDDGVFV